MKKPTIEEIEAWSGALLLYGDVLEEAARDGQWEPDSPSLTDPPRPGMADAKEFLSHEGYRVARWAVGNGFDAKELIRFLDSRSPAAWGEARPVVREIQLGALEKIAESEDRNSQAGRPKKWTDAQIARKFYETANSFPDDKGKARYARVAKALGIGSRTVESALQRAGVISPREPKKIRSEQEAIATGLRKRRNN